MLGLNSFLSKTITTGQSFLKQQTRNTFVLKRRWPPPLHKQGGKLPKMRARHFIYDLVQDTNVLKKPDMTVILKDFVDGVGKAGDLVTLRPIVAYRDYLMPGLAVYASPENITKYKSDLNKPKEENQYSSPYVHRPTGRQIVGCKQMGIFTLWTPVAPSMETIGCLSRLVLEITMNKLVPWTLEPWHVRTSFRKAGFVVPEHAIEMPPVTIKGPDLSLQDKEFYVTVTINKTEKVNVRCRIHHWATGLDRLPWTEFHWKKPKEPLIPEQAAELEKMPLPE